MKEKFRILMAYDGSECAEVALADLKNAGLAEKSVEALVVSVAEVWLPPQDESGEDEAFVTEGLRKKYEARLEVLHEAEAMAEKAARRLGTMFPEWRIAARASYGSPAWEILFQAGEFAPDLIVVGAQGLSAIGRVLIGSVSQKIVTEAKCSVRVARGQTEPDDAPARIVIGYDGTKGADEAVETVAGRCWRDGSEARVVIVADAARVRNSLAIDDDDIENVGSGVVERLWVKGLTAELVVREGSPKQAIVEEAESWNAGAIFIGATKFSDFFTKYLLGSVSSAVVTRAGCSVEIVRPNGYGK